MGKIHFFHFGSHQAMFMTISGILAQASLLIWLGIPYRMLGIESGSAHTQQVTYPLCYLPSLMFKIFNLLHCQRYSEKMLLKLKMKAVAIVQWIGYLCCMWPIPRTQYGPLSLPVVFPEHGSRSNSLLLYRTLTSPKTQNI